MTSTASVANLVLGLVLLLKFTTHADMPAAAKAGELLVQF